MMTRAKKMALDVMLQKVEFQRSMQIVQDWSFAVMRVLLQSDCALTPAEIGQALERPLDPHVSVASLLKGLVISGYLDAYETADDTRYLPHQGCEPRLPLPYYCYQHLPEDHRAN